MTAQFCRLAIPVSVNRPLLDAVGRPVTDRKILKPGAFPHWADPIRARGWIQEAQRLLGDRARYQELDRPVNTGDLALNKAQCEAQFLYVLGIYTAIARVYNLLNIVWWNDPEARLIYRQWIAGLPFGTSQGESIFTESSDYNQRWFTKGNPFPFANRSTSGWGRLPHEARSVTTRLSEQFGSNLYFVPSAMLGLTPIPGHFQPWQKLATANGVYNSAVVRMKYLQFCAPLTSTPWERLCLSPAGLAGVTPEQERGGQVSPRPGGYGIKAFYSDGGTNVVLPPGFDDWRCAYLGQPTTFEDFVCSAPLQSYVGVARLWVNSLMQRSPQQIILDARANVVYANSRTFIFNPGIENRALSTEQDVARQRYKSTPELQQAAGVAGQLGAGLGPLGAIVSGAVAGLQLLDALSPKDDSIIGHGRDDLGRWKVQWERAYLSGNPTLEHAGDGAPILPKDEVIDPPGQGKAWKPLACSDIPESLGQTKSMVPWVIGAGLLTVGVLWYTSKPSRNS